jgi:signal transduction histidine kinase
METAALAAALLAPRFGGEGALARAKEEIASLQAEMAEESHLAGVGRLAAGVAHELNTPLGAVLAMVGSLSRTQAEPQVARRLEIMREAVEKCKAIIEKLLIYSRGPLEAEQGLTFSRFVRSELDLNRVIENSVELLKESLNQDGIRVKLDLHPLPTVRANSTQWAHVFNNLLVNARDALLSSKTYQPTVDIRTGTQNGQILVEVWDNGPGIPSEVQSKIFQPFYTTKEIGKGTGLGLAICKEVTRKHSGDIVAGTSDAGGAKFTITLPIQAPEN